MPLELRALYLIFRDMNKTQVPCWCPGLNVTLQLHALGICAPGALHKSNIFRVTLDTPIPCSRATGATHNDREA